MKRLLCIVGSMNAGGAETFLMKVYRQLDKTLYQMDFAVAVQEKGFYDDEIISLGGKIFHITPKSDGVIKNFNSIKKLVKDEKYHYVLRTSQHSLSALELLAAWIGGAKTRVFRSSNSNTTTGGGMDLRLHRICMFMPRLFANVRIAPSTEAAEFMFGKGCVQSGRAKLIQNGIDLEQFKFNDMVRKAVREEFGIQENYVVGHVGRFNQQKNHIKLLEVFEELKMTKSDSVLMLVGKGELEDKLRQIVRDKGLEDSVIFTGVRNDVPRLLCGMDVFVFPSLYEGMPNTVIEAQAAGLPCIISTSITREANITDLLTYESLNSDSSKWVDDILHTSVQKDREKISDVLYAQGYDIKTVSNKFVEMVYGG